MNKNEVRNFARQNKSCICLDENLRMVKLVDYADDTCIILSEDGTTSSSDKLIALKGRLKERDYNYIEARFNKAIK